MKTFDVYPLYPIEPEKGQACNLWDINGNKYLDFYGGHAVISIGHSHPRFVEAITTQVQKLAFYSNSVENRLQEELAELLGKISGYADYSLFLCNSGAEANENALKLASFHTQKDRVIAFKKAFHGRTSGAVVCTDNLSFTSPYNSHHKVDFVEWNNIGQVRASIQKGDVSAVIIEGIQGVGGINVPDAAFLTELRKICSENGVVLILDEIQSGYGRSGKFFAHQHFGIKPDIISIAKGMGNGFPVAGIIISPEFEAKQGMLGTTFGGNHLACAASIAVLKTIASENLIKNAEETGNYLKQGLKNISKIKEIRGLGLMIGVEFDFPIADIRKKLLFDKKILTGYSGTKVLRLLPPLCLTKKEADQFITSLDEVLKN